MNDSLDGLETPSSKEEWRAGADWRYALRTFLRHDEQQARLADITPQHYQLLAAIKGYPDREYATGTELAERMQVRRHSMVGLIDHSEALGLVRREVDAAASMSTSPPKAKPWPSRWRAPIAGS